MMPFKLSLMVVVALMFAGPAVVAGDPRADLGHQWVRKHPFSISAVPTSQSQWEASGKLPTYLSAGMNTGWVYGHDPYPHREALAAGVAVHAHVGPGGFDHFDQLLRDGGVRAWMIGDEPGRADMDGYRPMVDHIKQNDRTGAVTYVNAFPSYATTAQLRGDDANVDYTYAQYLDDIMVVIRPDVLMYDHYPFLENGTTHAAYFHDLMAVRSTAQKHKVPYWFWMQAATYPGWMRPPSESDMRMQMFSHLAAGYSAFTYWTYDRRADGSTVALLDADNNPSALYHAATIAHPQAIHLGQAIRFMTSTGVRFVPGQTAGATNSSPTGLTNWSLNAGDDPHLLSISVGGDGPSQNGLIGCFRDDQGHRAFMLVNLHHGAELSAHDAALTFTLRFDDTVDKLLMLDRETGRQTVIELDNHVLTVILPGGTGNLYKYDTGDFIVSAP